MFRTAFVGVIVIVAGIVAACQEPDPNYGDPSGIIGKKLPGETPLTGGTSSSGDGGGSTSGGSSGTPTAPAPTITVAAEHANSDGGGPAVPFSADCMTCHGGSGPATKTFAYGGLVSNSAGATIVVQVDGLNPSATDDAGYFWGTDTTAIAAGSNVTFYTGGSAAAKMPSLPAGAAGGACLAATGCHGGATPGPITVTQ